MQVRRVLMFGPADGPVGLMEWVPVDLVPRFTERGWRPSGTTFLTTPGTPSDWLPPPTPIRFSQADLDLVYQQGGKPADRLRAHDERPPEHWSEIPRSRSGPFTLSK